MFPPDPNSEANILVGLLALQSQLINRQHLISAVRQWVQGRSQTLGDILVARGTLRAGELVALNVLVGRLLERHGDDVDRTLAAVSCLRSVRVALEGVADTTLHAALTRVSSLPDGSDRTSAGDAAPAATTARAPTTVPTPAVPAAIARFRIERLLVEGNLGSLFLARDEELSRDVVVKQIHARYADDPEAMARFHREVKYASELEHSGIVPIYGAGHHTDGRRYYAMRYIKGEDLRAAIDRCHQSERASTRMQQVRLLVPRFVAVCRAIAYAHDRGVLHRDIKPENVMLSDDGETIVVDWGLAKSIDASSTAGGGAATLINRGEKEYNPTQQFQAIGTLAYMSPETACGDLERVGPRSDVFSLGATLYHVLTGHPPFSKSGSASGPLLSKVQKGQFPRPRAVLTDLPKALEAICLKAMAVVPEKRYRSARALAEDLERWQAGEPVHALAESWADRAARRLRRRPLRLTALAAIVFATAGAGITYVLSPMLADLDPHVVQPVAAKADAQQQELDEKTRELAALSRQHDMERQTATAALDSVRTERDAAHTQSAAALLEVKLAKLDVTGWKAKCSQADMQFKTLQQQAAEQMRDLTRYRAESRRGRRQLDSFVRAAHNRFQSGTNALASAFVAFEKRLEQPKSKQVELERRLAFAHLQRRLGDMHALLENHDDAESEYRRAIETYEDIEKSCSKAVGEELALARHNLAWLLVTSPAEAKRKPKVALTLAEQAISTIGDDGRLTQGIALYRNNEYKKAHEILWRVKKTVKDAPEDYDTSLLFLTMAECGLKERERAEMWFNEAQRRLGEDGRDVSRELERFRKEAEDLLAALTKSS